MAHITLPDLHDEHGKPLDDAFKVLALNPQFAEAIAKSSATAYGDIALSMREREAVRMRIAIENDCQLCLGTRFGDLQQHGVTEALYEAVADWRHSTELSAREKLVIEYAERYMTDHQSMDAAFFARINAEFSAREVFELTAIIGAFMANGRLLKVLGIDTSCSLSGDEIQRTLS